MKFDHSTRAQLNTSLRALYATSKGQELAKLAVYLVARPSAELQAAFGISVGAVAALKGRMNTITNAADTLNSLAGE